MKGKMERHPLQTPEAGRSSVGGLQGRGQETPKDVFRKVTVANLPLKPAKMTAQCKKHYHFTGDKPKPQRGLCQPG